MQTGDIVLIPFPFTDLSDVKVRPAVVITLTNNIHRDAVVCAVSSIIPPTLSDNEFIVSPNTTNQLRAVSIVKVDRIVTLKRQNVIAQLGNLNANELQILKTKFKALVD